VQEKGLEGVGMVILDEFHERSVDTDLCLALLQATRTRTCPALRYAFASSPCGTGRGVSSFDFELSGIFFVLRGPSSP
jgi:hypothetical protein